MRTLLCAAAALAVGLVGCDGAPTDPAGEDGAPVALNIQTSTTENEMISVIAVEVTGAGIPVPIIANFDVVDGVARGTLSVPAGQDRTFTGRGFDMQAHVTHEGSVVTDVRPGQGTVRIPLFPRGVGVPIEVTVGAYLVSIAPLAAAVEVDGTFQFSPTVTDPDGLEVESPDLTWGSSNPAFATVDGEGTVTGVYPGTARVVVSFSGVAAEAEVVVGEVVVPEIARVEVTPQTATVQGIGATTQFAATAFDASDAIVDGNFTWESDDPSVATVDAGGLATAVAAGDATISAQADGIIGTALVTVVVEEPVPTSIIVTPATSRLTRAETQQFTATVYDQFSTIMPGIEVDWSSLQPCTAAIDSEGLATALSGGAATIVASAAGLTGTATLDVEHASGSIPSSLQGDWLVCQTSTGSHKLTLHLIHEPGSEAVTGSVTMAGGSTSTIYTGSWLSNTLAVSWTSRVAGSPRTFSIHDGVPQSDDLLTGRYNDRAVLSTYDVQVVRGLRR